MTQDDRTYREDMTYEEWAEQATEMTAAELGLSPTDFDNPPDRIATWAGLFRLSAVETDDGATVTALLYNRDGKAVRVWR